MKLSRFIQLVLLAVIWVLAIVILLVLSAVSTVAAWSMPAWWILIVLGIGVVLSGIILSNEAFDEIDGEIENEFAKLSDAEIFEVMNAMDEVKENLGISIEIPLKNKKRKREDVDKALRNLSDTELLHLKDRLREGSIDEEKLLAWLESQREMHEQ